MKEENKKYLLEECNTKIRILENEVKAYQKPAEDFKNAKEKLEIWKEIKKDIEKL